MVSRFHGCILLDLLHLVHLDTTQGGRCWHIWNMRCTYTVYGQPRIVASPRIFTGDTLRLQAIIASPCSRSHHSFRPPCSDPDPGSVQNKLLAQQKLSASDIFIRKPPPCHPATRSDRNGSLQECDPQCRPMSGDPELQVTVGRGSQETSVTFGGETVKQLHHGTSGRPLYT